jgi:SSS family solute:Na+ symporter
VMIGVYTRWFNSWALLAGWAVGIFTGTRMAVIVGLKPTYPVTFGGHTFPGYTAFYTLLLNLAIAVVLTVVLNAIGGRQSKDETLAADYHA